MDKEKLQHQFDAFLENKVAPLAPKVKMGIFAAAFIVPVAACFFLLFSPMNDEIKGLKERKGVLEGELAEVRATVADLPKHQAEMVATEEKLRIASVLLPQQKDIPSLLTNISSLGTSAGLEFINFSPQPEVERDFYMEVPVTLEVRGPYHNVGSFLYQVSKLDRIVSSFNLQMSGPTMENDEMVLSTSLNLVTYRFK